MSDSLRLLAHTGADMKVLSALCQDAACRVSDMAYRPGERRFVVMMNRFCWEGESRKRGWFSRWVPERVRSALHIDFVDQAQLQGLSLDQSDLVLSLLAIEARDADTGAEIVLTFSGQAAIKLRAECVDAVLEDVSSPWPASRRPVHGGQ